MPKLSTETEHDTKAMRKFVMKIPYQHDIVWWFRDFERREKAALEGNGHMTGQDLVRR